MRFVFLLIGLLSVAPAHAAAELPIVTFQQKVEIVVQAQKDPTILEVKIDQKDKDVIVNLVADQNTDRTQAIALARRLIWLTKKESLDDEPVDDKKIGKGLYDYKVMVKRVDNVVLAVVRKPAKKKDIIVDPPAAMDAPVKIEPWVPGRSRIK